MKIRNVADRSVTENIRDVRDHSLAGKIAAPTERLSTKHPETNHRMEIVDLKAGTGKGGGTR